MVWFINFSHFQTFCISHKSSCPSLTLRCPSFQAKCHCPSMILRCLSLETKSLCTSLILRCHFFKTTCLCSLILRWPFFKAKSFCPFLQCHSFETNCLCHLLILRCPFFETKSLCFSLLLKFHSLEKKKNLSLLDPHPTVMQGFLPVYLYNPFNPQLFLF